MSWSDSFTADQYTRTRREHFRHALQDGFDALALDDVQERERRAGRLLGPTLQLREIAGGDVQIAGEHRLAHSRALAHRSDLFRTDRRDLGHVLRTKMPHRDLLIGRVV